MKRACMLRCLAAALTLLAIGCSKKKSSPTAPAPTPAAPVVYVAGEYRIGTSWRACFWRNGTRVELPG